MQPAEQSDSYTYELKVRGEVVLSGVTNDLDRRQAEHRRRWPDGQVTPVGGPITRAEALEWLRHQPCR